MPNLVSVSSSIAELANGEKWRTQSVSHSLRGGGRVLGRGSEPPPHQLGGVSTPSGVRREAPAELVSIKQFLRWMQQFLIL